MQKLLTVAAVLFSLSTAGVIYNYANSKPAQQQPPFALPSSGGTYSDSGKTPQQTLNEQVKDGKRVFTVHSGLLVKNGELAILNNYHYKDKGNVPTVLNATLLPLGGIDALKGKQVVAEGALDKYKDQLQWQARSLEVR